MGQVLKILVLGFLLFLLPQRIFAEEIRSFSSDISIEEDGTIKVIESIIYDFGSSYRHGIFRKIPFIKTNGEGKKFQLKFNDISVIDEKGQPYKIKETKENGFINLKIGDPDQTITGAHTYKISYTVIGALTYFSDHVELYWNATGEEWEVFIRKASATVQLPGTIDKKDVNVSCFTGLKGSTDAFCSSQITKAVLIQTSKPLSVSEGLTIVIGFPRGIVSVLEPELFVEFWETPLGQILSGMLFLGAIVVGIIWYIFVPGYLIYRWHQFGRDPKPAMGVTSAWFEAPKTKTARKLTPGETGSLIDEKADLRDIFATIVDLARRGYLKIIENKKNDYTLMKLHDRVVGETLMSHEQKLLDEFFKSGELLKLKGSDLVSEVQKVQDSIYVSLIQDEFFPENPKKLRDMYSIIGGVALFTFNLPLFLICMTFGQAMPRKTMRGAQEATVAQSLKNFLSSQDEKLEYQAKNYMFFEKFLPFAIAFGVEKIWAERFSDISMKQPDWYVSSSPGGAFHSASFVSSLNASFSGITSAATPTRSSSGFSSGFGGSSGGGGGGGGGGSW